MTTRNGGVSATPYGSFNLATHVGDDPACVLANRELLNLYLENAQCIQWLEQVHGTDVMVADGSVTAADGSFTVSKDFVLAILTADCLPVLFCNREGTKVGAAHAGWRGLSAGILENTFHAMGCDPQKILVWLGPAISAENFEVGGEVLECFIQSVHMSRHQKIKQCFSMVKDKPGYYLADLYQLAIERLNALGIEQIFGGEFCSWKQADQFYSYRRNGTTGRMASLIYIS